MTTAYSTNINTDRALSVILSRFETEAIYSIARENIRDRWRPYGNSVPSLRSFEDIFHNIISRTEDSSQLSTIYTVRNETYKEILDIICEEANLSYDIPEEADLYGITYWIYHYFVSDFTNTLINFYCNFIYREKSQLYLLLDINGRQKDASITYAKKVLCNDKELIAIHANITAILDAISGPGITLEQFLECSLANNNPDVYNAMIYALRDNDNCVSNYFFSYLYNPNTRDDLITTIKLELQRRFS